MKFAERPFFKTLKCLFEKYERRVSVAAFLLGFLWDNLTLTRVDLRLDNAILLGHLTLIGVAVALMGAIESGRLKRWEPYRDFIPLLIQFSFGALFSGLFIFYFRSASLAASWPFLLFLLFFLVGNEFFRARYQRLTFQVSVYFIALFSYAVFAVPVALGRIGTDVFLISGVIALLAAGLFIFVLSGVGLKKFAENRIRLAGSVGILYLFFNLFYFADLIPPLPLSLKELVIAHAVTRTAEGYEIRFEPASWYWVFREESGTFHRSDAAPVYAFSAVFAPTRISTAIFHRWSYFDEKKDQWAASDTLSFPITGGRDGGYRGFTFKQNLEPGRWRVEVVTEEGKLLGRKTFLVEEREAEPRLESVTR